jgi:hypothetical protein
MKRCQSLLVCILAMFGASADSVASRGPWPPQAGFADIRRHVVKDIKATSIFVQEQAAIAATPNRGLIVLAGLGLVVLQLRRKHRSLPQRRIAPFV